MSFIIILSIWVLYEKPDLQHKKIIFRSSDRFIFYYVTIYRYNNGVAFLTVFSLIFKNLFYIWWRCVATCTCRKHPDRKLTVFVPWRKFWNVFVFVILLTFSFKIMFNMYEIFSFILVKDKSFLYLPFKKEGLSYFAVVYHLFLGFTAWIQTLNITWNMYSQFFLLLLQRRLYRVSYFLVRDFKFFGYAKRSPKHVQCF